ncbi:MAG: hypothetical protein D6706_11150 [Chloroflexi bacterium]|nr:MAG: hypothetical protein D6706_11150 [Chloroflexota bacterium]
MRRARIWWGILITITGLASTAVLAISQQEQFMYLPVIQQPIIPTPTPTPLTEFRGLWVSRFDWTSYGQPADPAKIDEIVQNAAMAGFNVIFFQVRGTADAYYTPGLEPWAQRVSGNQLGQPPDPLWDPLAYFIQQAHAAGLQLHAYINVYPVWDNCLSPPPATTPQHFYYTLQQTHGTTNGKLNGLQWHTTGEVSCETYLRATPASVTVDDHLIAVATDLVTRYDIDGIHLDHIRYAGSTTSCDPVSTFRFGATCFSNSEYGDWQRQQVNGTVRRFYEEVVPLKARLWLSAAVWPIYQEKPEWGWGGIAQQGYVNYFQDSKAWLSGGYIDSISPMIYPGGSYNCPDDSFWSVDKWETLVRDFQADANGRFIIPGIGTGYCTFAEIEARINLARQIGTAGHALFSYKGLLEGDYFDDLAAGPYAEPATVPTIDWHP